MAVTVKDKGRAFARGRAWTAVASDGTSSACVHSVIKTGAPYTGSYTVTPSASTQTIHTANKLLSEDIVVNPIPSNYGLVSWNGSVLTVR